MSDKTRDGAVGNAAAMRDAIEFCEQQMTDAICDENFGDDVVYLVGCMSTCIDYMKHALSAPARNVDRYNDKAEAAEAHLKYHLAYIARASNKFDFPMEFDDWLFATEKGGAE